MEKEKQQANFEQLLIDAVKEPGKILQAYSLFHDYSLGNQLLAMFQCSQRGLDLSPINTYKGWQKLGRQVRKGEKALSLCMPVTCAREEKNDDGTVTKAGFTRFIFRNNWFVMAQTDGDPQTAMPQIPRTFDIDKALAALSIERIPFDLADGNVQGFARKNAIAISPIAALPHKTTFHEMAHVMPGHTSESQFSDSETMPRNLKEVEAESVAMLVCASLDLPGVEFARGYIQNWLGNAGTIPEKSAQKIFRVANQILKAGEVTPAGDPNQIQMFEGNN